MSKTYKKYPKYLYKKHGEYCKEMDDFPDHSPEFHQEFVWEPYMVREEVWKDWFKHGEPQGSYKTTDLVEHRRKVWLDEWVPSRWYSTPCETIVDYDKKGREGWKDNRLWCSQGVGVYNKRLRQKRFRAQTREQLHRCLKGDEDYACFPKNCKRDRWDFW